MINEFHVLNEKRCKIFLYLVILKAIVIFAWFNLAGATWYDNAPPATGTAQTVANQKTASNLMHIKQSVMTNTAYYDPATAKWYQGWDNADPSTLRINRFMASSGTPVVDYNPTWGFGYVNYVTGSPQFCLYNPTTSSYECLTTGSESGVSGIKTPGNSYSTSSNYVQLGFNATQAEVGNTTYITPTSFYGEYREINIDSVKGGNTYAPTENYYGYEDDVNGMRGAWAMEFSTAVTDTVRYAWNVPDDMDVTEDHFMYIDAFVPAIDTRYITHTFRMALVSSYSDEKVVEITPSSWTPVATGQSPLAYIVTFPITITAGHYSGEQGYADAYALSRKKYTGDLTTTVNVTNLKLKYKRD